MGALAVPLSMRVTRRVASQEHRVTLRYVTYSGGGAAYVVVDRLGLALSVVVVFF